MGFVHSYKILIYMSKFLEEIFTHFFLNYSRVPLPYLPILHFAPSLLIGTSEFNKKYHHSTQNKTIYIKFLNFKKLQKKIKKT